MTRRIPFRSLRWSTAFAAAGIGLSVAAIAQTCFTVDDNKALRFEVFQLAPPPDGSSGYPFYPLTASASMQMHEIDEMPRPGISNYYFQWANRSTAPVVGVGGRTVQRKLNIQPFYINHRTQRSAFSTIERANACSLAQAATMLGGLSAATSIAASAGIKLVSELAQPDDGNAGPIDGCVVANGPLSKSVAGIVLDYEVADGRSPQQTMDFLGAWAHLVHASGKKAILLIDPFNAPSQIYNGISSSNATAITQIMDRTTLFLWKRSREHDIGASYAAQMAILRRGSGFDPRKILVDFDLAETSVADASAVHAAILRDGLAGVVLWRNGAQQGGACETSVNQKIRALLFG